jgi:Na+/phosphate symporter
MMILIALIVCIIGGLLFRFAVNPKTARLGEIAFFCGLFIFLLQSPQLFLQLIRK